MSTQPAIVRLYIAQHGQSASTVVTAEDGQAVMEAIIGRAPFFLSTEETGPNREVVRTSIFLCVPAEGGVVFSVSKAVPIPLSSNGAPIPLDASGRPVTPAALWDDPRAVVRSTFERLPWYDSEPTPSTSKPTT